MNETADMATAGRTMHVLTRWLQARGRSGAAGYVLVATVGGVALAGLLLAGLGATGVIPDLTESTTERESTNGVDQLMILVVLVVVGAAVRWAASTWWAHARRSTADERRAAHGAPSELAGSE